MTRAGRRLSEADIERIVIDADSLGAAEAARKHGISRRTIERYRARVRVSPESLARIDAHRAAQARAAREPLSAARQQLLERVLRLAEESKSLRDCVGALKIVSDAIASDLVMSSLLGPNGDEKDSTPPPEGTRTGGLGITAPRPIPLHPKPPESA